MQKEPQLTTGSLLVIDLGQPRKFQHVSHQPNPTTSKPISTPKSSNSGSVDLFTPTKHLHVTAINSRTCEGLCFISYQEKMSYFSYSTFSIALSLRRKEWKHLNHNLGSPPSSTFVCVLCIKMILQWYLGV